MNWEIEYTRDGQYTVKANNIYLYSKYYPKKDVAQFINKELNLQNGTFLLVGLGLGYHLEELIIKTKNQLIFVLPIDEEEIALFKQFGDRNVLLNDRVKIIDTQQRNKILPIKGLQVIIPIQWLRAIGMQHPLYDFLLDIKTRQMSFQSWEPVIDENFKLNLLNNDNDITDWYNAFLGKKACLVSAGPSLDQTVSLIKMINKKCFVLCVGSALKVLLKNSIVPDAVIITDPSDLVIDQLLDTNYQGVLFYLSTAHHNITRIHKGKRFILFQKGYIGAEEEAKSRRVEVLETGGSVATTSVTLLEYMGFQEVYLFGQDLGFTGAYTHATNSTSGKIILPSGHLRKIIANNGETINTTSSLYTFHRWFEKKSKETTMRLFNTAYEGAKIKGIPYIDNQTVLSRIIN